MRCSAAMPLFLTVFIGCSDATEPRERYMPNVAGRWVGEAEGFTLALVLSPVRCELGCGGTASGSFTYTPGAISGTLAELPYWLWTPEGSSPTLDGTLWELENPSDIILNLEWDAVLTSDSTMRVALRNTATDDSPLRDFASEATLVRQ